MNDKKPCHSCGECEIIEEVREDEIYYVCHRCGYVENSSEYLKQLLVLLEKTIMDLIDNVDEKNVDAWVEKHRYHGSVRRG